MLNVCECAILAADTERGTSLLRYLADVVGKHLKRAVKGLDVPCKDMLHVCPPDLML